MEALGLLLVVAGIVLIIGTYTDSLGNIGAVVLGNA